jgi:hypothetical protein
LSLGKAAILFDNENLQASFGFDCCYKTRIPFAAMLVAQKAGRPSRRYLIDKKGFPSSFSSSLVSLLENRKPLSMSDRTGWNAKSSLDPEGALNPSR